MNTKVLESVKGWQFFTLIAITYHSTVSIGMTPLVILSTNTDLCN